MSKKPLVIKPDTYRSALNVVGTDVTVLASKQETSGPEFTFQTGNAGMGPPPHSHDWDEAFFVTKGSVEITCDGISERCEIGTLVFVPAGTVHSFKYGAEGGEMLEIAGAGSGAAQVFTALDSEIPAGPPDVKRIVEVMADNGVTVHI